jgi:hypothetical protein
MPPQTLTRAILRYTVGVGGVAGGLLVGITAVATTFPLRLLAMIMVGIAGLIAPLLVAAETGADTVDEGAEAGFVSSDGSAPENTGVSFPGRLEAALSLIGFGVVGILAIVVLA